MADHGELWEWREEKLAYAGDCFDGCERPVAEAGWYDRNGVLVVWTPEIQKYASKRVNALAGMDPGRLREVLAQFDNLIADVSGMSSYEGLDQAKQALAALRKEGG